LIKKDEKEEETSKFLKYIMENRNGDCAEDVFKRAKTPWQKQVAVELFVAEKDRALIKKDMSHVKKLVWAIFAVVILTAVANFASTYIIPLLGV